MSIFQPKKKTVEPDAVPTNVEQAIPIQGVFEDGIFLVEIGRASCRERV